jgi:putative long chain acyl-CoA synthase
LGSIPAVDLVVAYGVEDDEHGVLCAAVTLRPDTEVTAADLDHALDRLPRGQRPTYVQAVASIPLTTWHRPIWRDLQRKGVPKPGRNRQVWQLVEGHYVVL